MNGIAQMAESADALVSNTNGVKPVPVRPRFWAHEGESFSRLFFFRPPTLKENFIRLLDALKIFKKKNSMECLVLLVQHLSS